MTVDELADWVSERLREPPHLEPGLAEHADAAATVRELGRAAGTLGLTPLVDRCRVGEFVAPHAFRSILSDAMRSVREAIDAERMVNAAAPRRDWYSVAEVAGLIARDPAAVREDIRAGTLPAHRAPGTSYYRIAADDVRAYVERWRRAELSDRPRGRH